MRFKNLLLEQESKEKFFEECHTFLQKNKNKLQNGNYLLRGTKTSYDQDIIQKSYRERRGIQGSWFRSFLYEKFRPKKVPPREKMVPTQYGKRLDAMWNDRDIYTVFPVGSSYKLVYTSRVYDFNIGNPFISPDITPISILTFIRDNIGDDKKNELDIFDQLLYVLEVYSNNISSRVEHNANFRVYNKAWEFIIKNEEKLKSLSLYDLSDQIDEMKEIRGEILEFFENTDVSKEMPNEQRLEVNVYAPKGFYYVDRNKVTDILLEYYKEK